MIDKTKKFRLGVFLFICIGLLMGLIIMLVGNQLIEKRKTYYIEFENVSVSGLEVGSTVKYHGLSIGRVTDISIDEDNVNNIIAKISVEEEVPISKGVKAKIVIEGITGTKQIELSGGKTTAEPLEPGGYIEPEESYITSMSGKAMNLANKADYLLNNLNNITENIEKETLSSLLKNLDSLIVSTNTVIGSNEQSLNNIITNVDRTTKNMATISDSLNNILREKKVQNILANTESITDSLNKLEYNSMVNKEFRPAISDFRKAIRRIDLTVMQGQKDILKTLNRLEEISYNLREFSRQINDNPSILIRPKKRII